MATKNIDLIRSGLPWSSPLKIIVQSSEIINDATINRGLLNLLNNDYYLDIKTEAINNYIEDNLAEHIADTSIHFTLDKVKQLIGASTYLKSNTFIKIPVVFYSDISTYKQVDIELINELIDMIPRMLNGYTLIIQFVISKNTSLQGSVEYSKFIFNCISNSISLDGFANGTLLITSNCSNADALYFNSYADIEDISNLSILQQTSDLFIAKYKQIIKNINKDSSKLQKSILFQGTGINSNYSVFSINDSSADIYLDNIEIANTLPAFTKEAIATAKQNAYNKSFPQKENLLALFLCNGNITTKKQISAKEKYTNYSANCFLQNPILDVSTKNSISALNANWTNQSIQKCISLNTNLSEQAITSQPDYLTFNNDDNSFEIDTLLRSYMYNYNGLNTNFSICFFGTSLGNNQHIPLISDYNIDKNNVPNGIYVYADQIYSTKSYITSNNARHYYSNINGNTLNNISGLYVIDFITTSLDNSNNLYNKGCYGSGYRVGDKNYYSPSANTLLINVHFIHGTGNNPEWTICIPNTSHSVIDNLDQNKYSYVLNIPSQSIYANNNFSIKLFGNKVIQEITNFMSWHYYSGKIRNLFLFKKILTTVQVESIYKKGLATSYYWTDTLEQQIINNISTSSYIGALSLFNSNKVNLSNICLSTVTN